MIEIGVRELKRDLSAYLKRAADGEHVRVTMRGAPLVDLVRPGSQVERAPGREALVADGRLTPARRDHLEILSLLGRPRVLPRDPHALLLDERAGERRKARNSRPA